MACHFSTVCRKHLKEHACACEPSNSEMEESIVKAGILAQKSSCQGKQEFPSTLNLEILNPRTAGDVH